MGTGNMNRHMKTCLRKSIPDVGQMLFNQSSLSLRSQKFDIEIFREKIYMAMIRHELPFQFVEYEGIREALSYVDERITLVSRNTAKDRVLKFYMKEKGAIKNLLHSAPGRVSLTSDLWTSISTDGYVSLTAHFIDSNWKLQKRLINFSHMPSPHTGVALAEKIFKMLNDWGVELKLFTLTLDNAYANDVCVNLMKNQLNLKNALLCDGKFYHLRCCAHILNLIVQDGLDVIDKSVLKIRETVKYLKGSQQRKQKFLECVEHVSLEARKSLRQDVSTRWNYTYLMLESAIYYRRALLRLELSDSNYKYCPRADEWVKVEKICRFLSVFYKATCIFSGTQYPTANLYFPQVFAVQQTLVNAISGADAFLRNMAFVEWCYNKLYGKDSAQLTEVRDSIFSLFAAYMRNTQELPSTSRSSPNVPHFTPSQDSVDVFMADFDTFEAEELTNTVAKSQLEMYLDEPKLDRRKELDVLEYWRGNQFRYPELALMARDVLAIPVSTVASESAFSVSGRVVDKFRSALKPSTVEALVTTRDWIFGNKDDMEPSLD